jgi:hypothetical protein
MALHPVNEFLTREFPWLQTDPDPIMGDSRPRTVAELLKKDNAIWQKLYQEFVAARYSSYANGLDQLRDADQKKLEYTSKFQAAYPNFYADAGQLKDAVRKDPTSVPARFPWAPPNPKSMLGDARPTTFEALLKEGPNSRWMGAFKAWCRAKKPFDSADGWLDWVVSQAGGNTWARTLDPVVGAFADEIGRIKDRMHEKNDSGAAQFGRRVRQVGEAMADHWVDKADELSGGSRTQPPRVQQPQGQQTGQQKPQGQQTGQQKPQGQQTGQQKPPGQQTAAKKQQPAQQKPADPAAAARRSLLKQIEICELMVPLAADVATAANQLGHKYAAFGGRLANEAESLYTYRQVVSDASRALQVQAAKSKTESSSMTTMGIFATMRELRYAAYVLAWQIDLGYATDAGKWPHDRIGQILTEVGNSQCIPLFETAGRALLALCDATCELYDQAANPLDLAKGLIEFQTPGYDGGDGAEPWGTHEVVGAADAARQWRGYADQLAGQPPGEDIDTAARDDATQQCFGTSFEQLETAAGMLV